MILEDRVILKGQIVLGEPNGTRIPNYTRRLNGTRRKISLGYKVV